MQGLQGFSSQTMPQSSFGGSSFSSASSMPSSSQFGTMPTSSFSSQSMPKSASQFGQTSFSAMPSSSQFGGSSMGSAQGGQFAGFGGR